MAIDSTVLKFDKFTDFIRDKNKLDLNIINYIYFFMFT